MGAKLGGWVRALAAGLALAGGSAWAADVQVASVVDNPDPVPAGGLYTYQVRVDNNASDASTNSKLTFSIASGAASFVSASPASANCTANGTTVTCDLGTVGGLGSDPRLITLQYRALGPAPATITSHAEVSASNDSGANNNTHDEITTVSDGADLTLAKTGSPNPVVGGGQITYTLTPSNLGPNDSQTIVVTDTMPPAVTPSTIVASGSNWTCTRSNSVVTCSHPGPHPTGAAIPPITITGTVVANGGTITNSARVQPDSGGTPDPIDGNNTATVDTAVSAGADVLINQKVVVSGTPVASGSNATFRIEPRNNGPVTATGVTVSDPLPAGWTFVSASGPNWSCSSAPGSGTAGPTVSCSRASLPVGATDDITVVAKAPDASAIAVNGTGFNNTATIRAGTNDPVASNNSAGVTFTVLRDGADLQAYKVKSPNPVAAGGQMASSIDFVNNGPRVATGQYQIIEYLPPGETYVSSGNGWTCTATAEANGGTTLTCTHPNPGGLPVHGWGPTLTLTTTAAQAGSLTNVACVGGSVPTGSSGSGVGPVEGDPNSDNNCASATAASTTVQPDLKITKDATTANGDKTLSTTEDSVVYTLVVSNISTTVQNATGVVIKDTIPAYIAGKTGLTATVATSAGSTATFGPCSISNADVVCTQNGGELKAGETATVTITATRPMLDGVDLVNTATVDNTKEGDPDRSNNRATATVTIEPIADVELTGKTVTPGTILAGQNVTYVISYRNNGPSVAKGVTVSDAFTVPSGDSGFTVVSVASSRSGSTCTAGGAAFGAGAQITTSAGTFSCAIGDLANGETQSITLVVRPNYMSGNPARTIPNTATVATTTVESPVTTPACQATPPTGPDNCNNSKTATLQIQGATIDLLVNKTDVVDPVGYVAGATFIDYVVTAGNLGPSFATGGKITETMSPPIPSTKQVTFVCDTVSRGSAVCNSPSLCSTTNATSAAGAALDPFTCSFPAGNATTGPRVGDLAVGQSKQIFLRFSIPGQPPENGEVYTNKAAVSSSEPDSNASNDIALETTTLRQRVDLRAAKSATNAAGTPVTSVTVNQPFNWVISVSNGGPGDSQITDVTDTLPANTSIVGTITVDPPTGAATPCTVALPTVTCHLGKVLAGKVAKATIPVVMTGTGSITNSATVDTDPTKTGAVDSPGGNNTGTRTVSVTAATLSGVVFEDRDRNGGNAGTPQAAATEPRVAGVTITLTGTDAYGNTVSKTTTTAADGSYSFTGLAPSGPAGYTITETQKAGYTNGPAAPPIGAGGANAGGVYDRGGATGNSTFTGVTIGATTTAATGYNFPEVLQPGLSGYVYVDVNANGVRDPGVDPAVPGATVRLLNASTGAVVATTATAADGSYAFTGIDPLTPYTLEEPLPTTPANLANGPVNPGLVNGAACASGCTAQPNNPGAGTDRIASIDLSVGLSGTQFNFGEIAQTLIRGTVYVDGNRNGTMDPVPVDTRLGGVTVTLYPGTSCSGTPIATALSDVDGSYAFANVGAGSTYTVCMGASTGYLGMVTNPGTSASTPANGAITVTALPVSGSINNNFGLQPNSPDLRVTKTHSPAIFTTGQAVTYTISVRNAGEVPSSASYTVDDRLPAGLTLSAVPSGPGWSCTGAAGANTFSCTASTSIGAGLTNPNVISVPVNVAASAAAASPSQNAVLVDGGGEIDARRPTPAERDAFAGNPNALPVCTAAIDANACRDPVVVQLAASVSGTVWFDGGTATHQLDGGDRRLAGWQVEIVDPATGAVIGRATTGSDGAYRVSNLIPGVPYQVRFRDPASGVVFGYPVNGESGTGSSGAACANGTPAAGRASSCVGSGAASWLTVVLAPGQDLPQQSLPVDPGGVVYSSATRQPVPGSIVTMAPVGSCPGWDPSTQLVGGSLGGYVVNGSAVSMTVGSDGFYQFYFAPSAPARCTFGLTVTPPAGYRFQSQLIPPAAGPLLAPGSAGAPYPVQPQAGAPTGAIGPATLYYLTFISGSGVAGVIHNHLPLDPDLPNAVTLTKTGDRSTAEVGDTVRYAITVSVAAGQSLPPQTTIIDHLPAGFTYVRGTASVNDVPIADPAGMPGPTLAFNLGQMPASRMLTLHYRVRVGVGAQQGDGINTAVGHACSLRAGCVGAGNVPVVGAVTTNTARFQVHVTGGVFTTDACVLGKIFVDCNGNHVQDREELGIPGVRLVMSDGTTLISDSEGKYSICGVTPNSHVLKVDPSTLPRGARMTTSSNRNLGDAQSLWLDLKNGELHRADFVEGSCSNEVLDQVKARRAQGEVRAPETERKGGPALRFDSKAHGLNDLTTPAQGTDSADQAVPKPRTNAPAGAARVNDGADHGAR